MAHEEKDIPLHRVIYRHVGRLNSENPMSYTLGCVGRNDSEPTNGSRGHAGGTKPGQT